MAPNESKKGTRKPVKETPSNVHVLPLRPQYIETPPETETAIDFKELALKLEQRIGKIEQELKGSFDLLEKDIQQVLKSKVSQDNESTVRNELDSLTQKLESRFLKTLSVLSETQAKNRKEKENIERVKKLSSQLIKILSVDFYKNVMGKLGSVEMEEEIDPFGMDKNLVRQIKPLFDFLYYRYWRVKTTGIENIPNDGKALIVANHSGTVPYDGAMVKAAIINEHMHRKDARFLVEDFVYHMPMLGTLMYRIGGVRACPENAELLLNAGHLVIVFPEGVKGIGKYYSQRYKLQRFGRGGFIKLCMKTDSPLIPVGVVGAEEIHPIIFKSNVLAKAIGLPYIPITPTFPLLGLLGCIPLPSRWAIHFGKPVDLGKYSKDTIEDELLIHKLSEKVRGEIQNIIIELLRNRRSVWGK